MKIRRMLATTVVAAVTAPAVLLSATPALADAQPSSLTEKGTPDGTQKQSKPSIAELERAAAEAKKVYEDAVAAEKAAVQAFEDTQLDTWPLGAAARAAKKKADEAATAKTAAGAALTAATDALAALPETATEEERTAAQKAVTDAEAVAEAAADAKTAADAEAAAAVDAADDVRVDLMRKIGQARKAVEAALTAKEAADKALADAKADEGDEGNEGGDCVPEPELTTVVNDLPSKVVAGTTVDFSLRVTNGSNKDIDQVWPFVSVHAMDTSGYKDIGHLLHLQWSTKTSPVWKKLTNGQTGAVNSLKAGAHGDVKLRLKVDASAPAGAGVAFVAGDYVNKDGSCGGTPDLDMYEFEIQAAGSKPGKVEDAKPGKSKKNTPAAKAQGGSSNQPVTNGSLAETGSSSAMPQLALMGAAAVAMGAGAVFVVRRRRAGSNA